ncbi:MAG: hypothetical protein C0408_02760 [Odoribacter sp.]|nr:hypothetical protein [Odoribacter sp.]
MKTRTLLFIALLIIMPAVSYGQLGKLIKNTASKALNTVGKESVKEANKEADSAAQKKADSMVKSGGNESANNRSDQTEGQGGGSQGGMNMGKLFGNKVDLKYNEEYSFTSRLYMQTETYDKKEVLKMDMFIYFSSANPSVGMETKSFTDAEGNTAQLAASMVMDGENKCFIVLTDVNGMKMGIISGVPDENTVQPQTDSKAAKSTPANFKKTGGTRVIAGYKCDEYSYTAEDKTSGKVWFTKEANLLIDKRGWQKTGMAAYYGNPAFNDGLILANEAYDDKGKLTMKSETKEINQKFNHSISVKGYTLRQSNLGQPKK